MTDYKFKAGDKILLPVTIKDTTTDTLGYRISYDNPFKGYKEKLEKEAVLFPTIPRCVANWIEECKRNKDNLAFALSYGAKPAEVKKWLSISYGRSKCDIFALAWIFGYKVKQDRLEGRGGRIMKKFCVRGTVGERNVYIVAEAINEYMACLEAMEVVRNKRWSNVIIEQVESYPF